MHECPTMLGIILLSYVNTQSIFIHDWEGGLYAIGNHFQVPKEAVSTIQPANAYKNQTISNCKSHITGVNYTGRISRTIGGHTCQAWSQQTPHNQTAHLRDEHFPDNR